MSAQLIDLDSGSNQVRRFCRTLRAALTDLLDAPLDEQAGREVVRLIVDEAPTFRDLEHALNLAT